MRAGLSNDQPHPHVLQWPKAGGSMLKRSTFIIIAGVLVGSSVAWAAQPAQISITATQAKNIAKLQTVSLLVLVQDRLFIRAPQDACTEIRAIDDWEFKKQIEDHVSAALTSRFTLVPKTYNADALRELSFGQIPRDALPPGDDVDAFVVVWGNVALWHPAGLPSPDSMGMGAVPYALSKLTTIHDPELQHTPFTIDIINAKTKRTIVRKEIQPLPRYGVQGVFEKVHWMVRGAPAKVREEPDWLCGNPLTEKREQELKSDYRMLIEGAFDYALPILRLTGSANQK
jgi:hypothetical protein